MQRTWCWVFCPGSEVPLTVSKLAVWHKVKSVAKLDPSICVPKLPWRITYKYSCQMIVAMKICVSVCVCVHLCVCLHVCMCMYVCACMCIHMCVCSHVYAHACMPMYVCMFMHVCACVHVCVCSCPYSAILLLPFPLTELVTQVIM